MNLHENVILDLLSAIRSGQASAESRALVEQYLQANPSVAQVAALLPTPDPGLELRALQLTRKQVGYISWLKGLALFFTLLPLSFGSTDERGVRLLFADYPGAIAAALLVAAVLWTCHYRYIRRSQVLS